MIGLVTLGSIDPCSSYTELGLEMVNNAERQQLAKRMRWTGWIIRLVITVFGGTMLIGEAISEFLWQGFVTTSIEISLLSLIGAWQLTKYERRAAVIPTNLGAGKK